LVELAIARRRGNGSIAFAAASTISFGIALEAIAAPSKRRSRGEIGNAGIRYRRAKLAPVPDTCGANQNL
jgi:hypothetical protein